MTTNTEPLDLAAIRQRCDAATVGEWVGAVPPDDTTETAGEYVANTCHEPNRHASHVHAVWSPGESDRLGGTIIVAFTGDGPTSYANREFIAHARTDVPALLDEVERLRDLNIRARVLLDGYLPEVQAQEKRAEKAEAERDALAAKVESLAGQMFDAADRWQSERGALASHLRALVSDWQANGNSRLPGDPTADVWQECARQLLTALDGVDR